jgi:dCMP deaminase
MLFTVNKDMKTKFQKAFMECAHTFAKLSHAKRAQVGCIIVKDNRVISIGYNGMPSGWDNNCEDITRDDQGTTQLRSKPEVLHAETNAIAKVAQSAESASGASLFCTHMPCLDCAKIIHQSGISHVYYDIEYVARKGSGKEFMIKSHIEVIQVCV